MKFYLSFLFLLFPILIHAQELLKPEQAVEMVLEKNYGIRAAQLQTDAANLQVFKGNAGMKPKVDWNTNIAGSFAHLDLVPAVGSEINRFAQTASPVSNVVMSYTLYDGRKMFATYDKLKNQSQLSLLQTRLIMETAVANILSAYYQAALQKQTVKYLETIIKNYQERLTITQRRWEFGKGSKIDFLQSKNDLNAQYSVLYNAQVALKNAKAMVNQLLVRSPEQDFDVLDSLHLVYNPSLEELKTSAKTYNKNLLILRKSTDVSRLVEKEAQSLKSPKITLNANYGYALTKSNAGAYLLNQNLGLTAGVGVAWNIFNGEITRRQIQTAKINTEIIQQQELDMQTQIEANLVEAYNQFQTNKVQLSLEEDNYTIANENLTIALEKFKLGASTILDIIEAQRSFDTSLNRLVNARYNVKVAELNLMQLSGELVK